jgi:HTH-type transcriptional regulator, competence development regulator
MLTLYGKYLKKIQIDAAESSATMAKRLGCTGAYLSAIVHGKRNIPDSFHQLIKKLYKLSPAMVGAFNNAFFLTQKQYTFNLSDSCSAERRGCVYYLYRYLDRMADSDVKTVLDLLSGIATELENNDKGDKC